MTPRPPLLVVLPALTWLLLLALLPWWLGLPLLLSLAAVLLVLHHRMAGDHVVLLRRSLRWGLPGVLLALAWSLGGDAFAWGAALLGALAGFTLIAGLEAWLDRELRRDDAAAASADWPELAWAPIGPAARIIELQPAQWRVAGDVLDDPLGGQLSYRLGSYRFAEGGGIDDAGPHASFSPSGRWMAARMHGDRGVALYDRERGKTYRIRGWHLCGWHDEQAWLLRREGDMPLSLAAVLGRDADEG